MLLFGKPFIKTNAIKYGNKSIQYYLSGDDHFDYI
jgi:hypothetical protein